MRILYLFSGQHRSREHHISLEVVEIDIALSQEHDLTEATLRSKIMAQVLSHQFQAILATPPCSTWSRVGEQIAGDHL